ncbi:MAG: glycosyltransferase family 4 protein [Candidatus Bathyarchaeota archaeon]|nr:glycosyltransferase family 4 protein [Candidatus Bathyarchaeota archaeon]
MIAISRNDNKHIVAIVGTDTISSTVSPTASVAIIHCNLSKQLSQKYIVHVYSQRGSNQVEMSLDGLVKHHHISSRFDYLTRYFISVVAKQITKFTQVFSRKPFYLSLFNDFVYALRTAKSIKVEKCNIVQIAEETQLIPFIKMINPKTKIVLSMHSELLTQLDRKTMTNRLKQVDFIIGCSDHVTKKIVKCFPQFSIKCQTINNGVNIKLFKPLENKLASKRILYVSRVTPEKGLHVLIEALARVVEIFPETHLNVIGSKVMWLPEYFINLSEEPKVKELLSFHAKGRSGYLDYLQERILELNLTNNVTFHGVIPHENLISYYQNSDLFVLPSFSEAFGMGLIEAMACGLPVVATDVGGIPEVVEQGKTGLLVESGDSGALAKAILDIFSDGKMRIRMSEAARKRAVKLFSWEKIANDVSQIYESLTKFDN